MTSETVMQTRIHPHTETNGHTQTQTQAQTKLQTQTRTQTHTHKLTKMVHATVSSDNHDDTRRAPPVNPSSTNVFTGGW